MLRYQRIAAILAGALTLTAVSIATAQNKFGIMTHLTAPSYELESAIRYMENAQRMAGEWGWVRQYVTADPDEYESDVTFLLLARAHKMVPVLYINDLQEEWLERVDGRHVAPKADPDGGYEGAARVVAEWVQAIENEGVEIPYLEIWNEPNLEEGWARRPDPAEYARYHVAVAKAVREVSPNIKFLNSAMSPSGGTEDNGDGIKGRLGDKNLDSLYFIEEMVKAEPEILEYIDLWSSHSYPLNQPPSFDSTPFTASGYKFELATLDQFDFHPKVLITETGYRLNTHANTDFPKTTSEIRIAWLVWAYFEVWLPDDDLVGVCPFLLGDPLWKEAGSWDDYAYIDDRMRPMPILDAVASLPRESGTDYMPAGESSIRGTVLSEQGEPIHRALVYALPGGYAAITGVDGSYGIEAIPAGDYKVYARASSHAPTERDVTLTGVEEFSPEMGFRGLIPNGDFNEAPRLYRGEGGDEFAPPPEGERIELSTDTGHEAAPCVSISGFGSIFDDTDYLSIEPGERYRLSVWVKYDAAPGSGARVELRGIPFKSHSPNEEETVVSARATIVPAGWQRIETYIEPTHKWTQRLRAIVSVESVEGTVYIDDLLVEKVSQLKGKVAAGDE